MGAKPSEKVAVCATVDPDANATGAFTTDYISMVDFQQAMFVVMAGVIAASGTLDFSINEATTATGAGATTLASGTLSITQMTTADNDEQAVVNVETQDLSTGFDFVAGVMTLTTAGADSAVIGLGLLPRYGPGSDNDLASVGEITG